MIYRILCFEDSETDRNKIEHAFNKSEHQITFLFFEDPNKEWNLTKKSMKEIREFNPHFAIVDLKSDRDGDETFGFRVIRKLKEDKSLNIPVIAYSVLLNNELTKKKALRYKADAIIIKVKGRTPNIEEFLSAGPTKVT